MSKSGGLAACLFGTAIVFGCFLPCRGVLAGSFRYAADEKWRVEETMKVRMPDPSSGKSLNQVSRMLIDYSVIRLFPDGSALVKKECIKSYMGASIADLKEIATLDAPPVGFLLLTGEGEVYLVQAKPVFSNPEEEEMAESFDFPNELGALEKADSTDEFLGKGREPMDVYKIGPQGMPVGRSLPSAGFRVTRLKDDKLGPVNCEVYMAKRGVVTENAWFDRRAGKLLQRRILQGDPASVEIMQVRR